MNDLRADHPEPRARATFRLSRPAVVRSLAAAAAGLAMLSAGAAETLQVPADEPISPIPRVRYLDPGKVALGRRLFFDTRISGNGEMSCASCHLPELGFADGLAISRGMPGYPGVTNTLSLLNVSLTAKLAWDGHALTLDEQIDTIIQKENTMGGVWRNILPALREDGRLTRDFDTTYGKGIERDTVIDALAQYLKSLDTPDAPFDRYLRGEADAIGEEAREGYALFKDYGCISCHQGVNVGGNMLQVFGIFGEPEAASKGPETPGSAQGTGISEDRPVFRVPVLRNVAQTAPYFHDGSTDTLAQAISIMARFQLGREISEPEIAKIEAFLRSLTGLYQGVPVGDM